MAYIGKEPIVGNFQKCDAITVVNGQAAYTLQVSSTNVVPESANHMLVSLNGILQAPVSSFTVSGSTLTFASNLATGDVIDFVILLGNVLDLGTPSDGTVTNAKLAQDIISGETALAESPASTDEILVSDGGTLKRIDYSVFGNTPAFYVQRTSNVTGSSDNTLTKLTWNAEVLDTNSAFASDKFTVPSGEGGKYFFSTSPYIKTDSAAGSTIQIIFYKNGSAVVANQWYSNNNDHHYTERQVTHSILLDLAAADYIEVYAKFNVSSSTWGSYATGSFFGYKLLI